MNNRKIALLLLASLLVTTAVSCGGESGQNAVTTPNQNTGTTSPEETSPFVKDNLPDDLDLGGKEVKLFIGDYNNAYISDMFSAEETGNRLSDAVYNTIHSVEDRLSAKLTYDYETYGWSDLQSFESRITAGIMAGDNSFDILFDVMNYTSQMLDGEYFIDLSQTKYIDLDKPWYNQTVRENMASDYVHFVSGLFSLVNIKSVFCMYFNADLYESLQKTENLYSLVDDGKWTLDKLTEITKDTYADLNGDTTADPGDRYGITFGDNNKYLGFLKAFGGSMFVKTADGFDFAYDSERVNDMVTKLCAFINDNENVLPGKHNAENPDFMISTGGGNYASKPFVEGNSLFSFGLIADAATIVPSINFSYGLLPYPKWDEAQDDYHNILQRNCYALIPTTVADEDAASAVLEALSSESYRTLVPEYCEVSLKVRYSQDDDVSRMFDLIINSIVYDPGEIYANLLGTPSGMVKTAITNNDPNWASRIAAQKEQLIATMEKVTK